MESRKVSKTLETRYEMLQQEVLSAAQNLYQNKSIANEITNMVLLDIGMDESMADDWASQVPRAVTKASETYFSDLWMYCFRYALTLTSKEDVSQDIAQEAIASLFRTDKQVEFIKGWLKRTVFNQAQKKIKLLKRESSLDEFDFAELIAEEEPVDEDTLQDKLDVREIRQYLSSADFKLYKKIQAYPNLKAYAKASKISYQTAREHRHMVLHNLKQNYFRKQGWVGTTQILSFRQMSNVKRFLRNLIEHAEQNNLQKISKYCPPKVLDQVESNMKDFKEVLDWGISMLDDINFEIYILGNTLDMATNMYVLNITINKGNSIRIKSCSDAELMGEIENTSIGEIPVDKGSCILSMDEIKCLIG
ncbi:MAG: hypothetical protein PHO16_04145 [Candidatus Cloacimonetes bacterium]|nr:hypothetical protein [Candidatus Cloacimonadota bacterium]